MTDTITTDPHQALAELEARVLAGDDNVSAAALQKARGVADLASLQQAAAERQAAIEAADKRAADEAAFRRELAAQAADLTGVQDAYGSVVDALMDLNDRIAHWQRQRSQLIARAHTYGLSDEATSALADLGRTNWVAMIADEAVGRFQTGSKRITVGGMSGAAPVFHALHNPQRRAAITEDRMGRLTETAARHAEREADKRRVLEADAAAARAAMRQALTSTDERTDHG